MPRKARIDMAGALQHIIVRGIERKKIFQDNVKANPPLQRTARPQIQPLFFVQA
jgi:hypothetical protein